MNQYKLKNDILKEEIAALIVAAGYSSRMGYFKPLLPLGQFTVIENTVNNFLNAGINNITVVLGHKAEQVRPVLEQKNIKWVYNKNYSEGMYSSVKTGISSLSTSIKAVYFIPVDIPCVKSQTIENLYQSFTRSEGKIHYPVYNNKRGHPPLISSQLFPEILTYDGSEGLKSLLKQYDNMSHDVIVADQGVLLDIDTYDDYLRLYNDYYSS